MCIPLNDFRSMNENVNVQGLSRSGFGELRCRRGRADHSAANLPSAHCDLDELPHITMELALCTNDEGCFLINGI